MGIIFFPSYQRFLHFPSNLSIEGPLHFHTSLKMKLIVSIYSSLSLPLLLTHIFPLFWHRLSHGLQHLGNICSRTGSSTGYRECSPPLLTLMSSVNSSLFYFLLLFFSFCDTFCIFLWEVIVVWLVDSNIKNESQCKDCISTYISFYGTQRSTPCLLESDLRSKHYLGIVQIAMKMPWKL